MKLVNRMLENMTSTEKGWNTKQAELEDLENSSNRNEMKFRSTK